jgi:hypothetical protein
LYNNMYLDSAGIGIVDTNAQLLATAVIGGRYTAFLQSGLGYTPAGAVVSDTTLSQTGLVPPYVQSLQFKAKTFFDPSGRFAVGLGGQILPLRTLATATNYTLYGADVSPWAGQLAQLSFTVFGEKPHVNDESLFLDDIQFSAESIPAAPSLLVSVSGGQVQISWTPPGGALQSSVALGTTAIWSPVGAQNPTNLPSTSGARFFRVAF